MKNSRIYVVVFSVMVLVHLAFGWNMGLDAEMSSDAIYFQELAVSMSEGHGYVLAADSSWDNQPTMRRLPAWPYVVSIAIKLFDPVLPQRLMRVTNLLFLSLATAVLFCLSFTLFGDTKVAFLTGVFFVFHPVAAVVCYMGWSELRLRWNHFLCHLRDMELFGCGI